MTEDNITMDYERGGLQKEHYSKDEVMARDCPLCDRQDYLDLYRERGAIGVAKCRNCGLIYTNPMVKDVNKNYWGEEKKYYTEAKLIFEGLAKHNRDQNYLDDLRIIEELKPQGNFLDIGTNMGFFLRHTRGKRWDVVGLEPSPSLSDLARKYFGLNVKTAYLKEAGFEDNFFDIVTMIDVFEHIAEPKEMLSEIKRIIKRNGILFIKVPNGNYSLLKFWMAKAAGRLTNYDIFDSYEHLTHYTHKTLEEMLKSQGFKVKKVMVGRPIHSPVWQKYTGHYYQYASPWVLDAKNHMLRVMFYWISKIEFLIRLGRVGYFASNIIVIAEKY